MGEYDTLRTCSIGPASFTLSHYTYSRKGIVKADAGRIGDEISVEAEGWIRAESGSAFAAALTAARTAFQASGQPLTITGVGGIVELTIAPAQFVEGGPHIDYSFADGDSMFEKKVKITFGGKTASDSGDGSGDDGGGGGGGSGDSSLSEKVSTAEMEDGREQIQVSGDLAGAELGGADAFRGSGRKGHVHDRHQQDERPAAGGGERGPGQGSQRHGQPARGDGCGNPSKDDHRHGGLSDRGQPV
jgi:hypothetical protein